MADVKADDLHYSLVAERFLEALTKKNKTIDANLVEVHIYLESNNIMTIEEQPNYGMLQLMNDLGGVIGLYLGLAVVSIFEICELLCLLLFIGAKRMLGVVSKYEMEEMVKLLFCDKLVDLVDVRAQRPIGTVDS